jgi:hypothetical protein
VITFQLYRVTGSAVTPATLATKVLVATLPGTVTQYLDITRHRDDHDHSYDRDHKSDECEKGGTRTVTYFIVATLADPAKPGATLRSGASNFSTVVSQCDDDDHDHDHH